MKIYKYQWKLIQVFRRILMQSLMICKLLAGMGRITLVQDAVLLGSIYWQNFGIIGNGNLIGFPGARLTTAFDVRIQSYRNFTQKLKAVKCIFCGVWVQNFVWNFKGHLWNFTQNFEPIHHKICNYRGVKNFTTYNIVELWHLKS